ncbi:MAG: major capsid protein [Rhodospirillaceae bacterium]
MATLASSALTLGEWATRLDPGGKPAAVIELLGQTNEMLTDMLWMQCNDGAGHKTTVRTGLPTATWRLLNYGVVKSKSTTAQVRDSTGMLEAYSDIDKALADLNGNTAEFRMGEDMAFIESMNQGMQGTVIYGNTTTAPERFTGLAPRFSALSAPNGGNIVNAGGSSNTNTSIWLIGWGQNTCHGLFPKGSKAGLQVRDLGEHPLYDANNNVYQGYRTHFKWDCGLTVRDWRFVVRVANVNVTAGAVTTSNLVNTLITAVNKLPFVSAAGNSPPPGGTKPGQVNTAFYCNRTVRAALDIQAMAKTNNFLTIETRDSKPYTAFRGIPIRICDQIGNSEANVS